MKTAKSAQEVGVAQPYGVYNANFAATRGSDTRSDQSLNGPASRVKQFVHSKVKLEELPSRLLMALYGLFVVSFLTFLLLGYIAGPEVSHRRSTGPAFTCEQTDFSEDLVSACLSSTGNSNLQDEPIQEVMKIDAVADCLFASCNPTVEGNRGSPPSPEQAAGDRKLVYWSVPIVSMTEKHRYLYVEVEFPNPRYAVEDFSFTVHATSAATGREEGSTEDVPLVDNRHEVMEVVCEKDYVFCEAKPFLYFNGVRYARYDVEVVFFADELPFDGLHTEFFARFGNTEFTNWEIGFKLLFASLALIVLLHYSRQLSKVRPAHRSGEQQWIQILLIVLVFYNNPFYAIEVRYQNDFFAALPIVGQVSFYALLFLFWLLIFDRMRSPATDLVQSEGERKHAYLKFVLPKALFIALFWIFTVLAYTYIKFQDVNDPLWDTPTELSAFSGVKTASLILAFIYVAWVTYLAISAIRRNTFGQRRGDSFTLRYKIFSLFSLTVVFFSVIGIFLGAFSPIPDSAGEWTGYLALFNLYMYFIAYLFSPADEAKTLPASFSCLRLCSCCRKTEDRSEVGSEALAAIEDPDGLAANAKKSSGGSLLGAKREEAPKTPRGENGAPGSPTSSPHVAMEDIGLDDADGDAFVGRLERGQSSDMGHAGV